MLSSIRIMSSLNDIAQKPITLEDISEETYPGCKLLQNMPFTKITAGSFGDMDIEFTFSDDKVVHQSIHIWFRVFITGM